VTGVDIEPEAIAYARKHYQGPSYEIQSAYAVRGSFDALVSFETLEHLDDPLSVLKAVDVPLVIASVPNEERYPFSKEKFAGDDYPHLRHYTPEQFHGLLNDAGYVVARTWCQKDKQGDIHPGSDGMFMIYLARRLNGPRLSER
jgi:hypothetical protein